MPLKVDPIPEYRYSWAVVIGINTYANSSEKSLDYAVNDARGVSKLLSDIGFKEIIDFYNEDATRDSILSYLTDENYLPAKIKKDDRLLIFFSGHGYRIFNRGDRSYSGFLIPHDGTSTKRSSLIDFNELTRTVSQAIEAKHILFVLDCCFSGIAAHHLSQTSSISDPRKSTSDFIEYCTSREAVQIITAGEDDQPVVDSSIFKGHSPFTGIFLKGIRTWQADLNNDGVLTWSELSTYLIKNVPKLEEPEEHIQRPFAGRLDGDKGGDFIIMSSIQQKLKNVDEGKLVQHAFSVREYATIIKRDTGCDISSLTIASDVVAISFPTIHFRNQRILQEEILSIISSVTKLLPISNQRFRITVEYPIPPYGDPEQAEIFTLQGSVDIIKRYSEGKMTQTELFNNLHFFKKYKHTDCIEIDSVRFYPDGQ